MSKLSKQKADKSEISSLQEALVKVEAMFSKVLKTVDAGPKNVLSKQQVEDLLASKVDREEYQEQIQQITKTIKKNKKNAIMNGGDFEDDGIGNPQTQLKTMARR